MRINGERFVVPKRQATITRLLCMRSHTRHIVLEQLAYLQCQHRDTEHVSELQHKWMAEGLAGDTEQSTASSLDPFENVLS